MTCPSCGSRNERGERFCKTCGTKLEFGKATQVEYEYGVLPEGPQKPVARTATLSKLSLVLGLLALTPLSFIAGIPAIIAALVAIRQRRPGAKMAWTGFITGVVGAAVITFAVALPFIAARQESARVAAVKANMKQFQSALEQYAADHGGVYPSAAISWSAQAEVSMAPYFKGALVAEVPVNPYTATRYEAGRDLFYLSGALPDAGLVAIDDPADSLCPFVGLAAPQSLPGTIVILGYSPEGERGLPVEYAIVGFGRDVEEPLARKKGGPLFVLHN